jgi:hypothetical protein
MKDDPVIEIPKDLNFRGPRYKKTEEEIKEELTCHDDTMDELKEAYDDKMIGGDMSLKSKILRERNDYNERKTFN